MRPRLAVGAAVLGSALAVGAAGAAGVGTIELTPKTGTAFHVHLHGKPVATQQMALRNIGKVPATARLYAAAAKHAGDGWSVSGAGSATWIDLQDQQIALKPGEKRVLSFTVHESKAKAGAVVLEQSSGTVVQRAATLVYLESDPTVTLPRALVVLAVVLLAGAGGAVLVMTRRRRPDEPS